MNRGDDRSDLMEEILARFGLRIAEQRKARGWTQRELEGLSGQERKRLRRLTIRARDLQGALRLFADELPPAPDEAEREIVRSRIECVVNDYLPLVIRSLEAALADAAPNAGDDLLPAGDGSL
jgi:transcriptional regulator with XRE-family HTH domain